jgi:hypothetical protein
VIARTNETGEVTLVIEGSKYMKYFALLASAIATGVILAKAVRVYAA